MPDRHWDAIVVGSGANGGLAAKLLAEGGARVLILEAGRPVEEIGGYANGWMAAGSKLNRRLVSRRQHIQSHHATYWTTNPNFFVDDLDNPYSTPEDKPFHWIRGRVVGGRTLTWDGVTPRMSDFELAAASRDGVGIDWPLRHADLAPFYDRVERYFGVHGNRDGLPQLPDGDFVSGRSLNANEQVFRGRVESEFPERRIILSRGIDAGRAPEKNAQHSRLSNLTTTLRDAARTGRAQLRANAVVSRVLLHQDGRSARGVEYIDADTRVLHAASADRIFLCASTIESVRLLLNSSTPKHPHGLGGCSGHLGRYLMDHSASNLYFQLPDVPVSRQPHPLRGSEAMMVPRFTNLTEQNADHLRGYGMWGGIDRIFMPGWVRAHPGEAFGFLCTRAEVLPHYDNHVSLDPELRDAWGIPCVRINCAWQHGDLAILSAARRAALEMVEAAGGEVAELSEWVRPGVSSVFAQVEAGWRTSVPGLFAHELGGARMGASPEESVVDRNCEVWDVKNLYVTDGACWPSSGWQNPTLTELAITARTVDVVLRERAAKM